MNTLSIYNQVYLPSVDKGQTTCVTFNDELDREVQVSYSFKRSKFTVKIDGKVSQQITLLNNPGDLARAFSRKLYEGLFPNRSIEIEQTLSRIKKEVKLYRNLKSKNFEI